MDCSTHRAGVVFFAKTTNGPAAGHGEPLGNNMNAPEAEKFHTCPLQAEQAFSKVEQ
jgi:hypothetical protein